MRRKWFGGEIWLYFSKFKGIFCPGKGLMVISVKGVVYKAFKYIELCCFHDSLLGGFDWGLFGDLHFSAEKWPAGCADWCRHREVGGCQPGFVIPCHVFSRLVS